MMRPPAVSRAAPTWKPEKVAWAFSRTWRAAARRSSMVGIGHSVLLPSPPVLRGRGAGGEGAGCRTSEQSRAVGCYPPSPPSPLPLWGRGVTSSLQRRQHAGQRRVNDGGHEADEQGGHAEAGEVGAAAG